MIRLLVIVPLTLGWLAATLVLLALLTPGTPSGGIAKAGPYLTLDRCRVALQGHDGSDNDVWREFKRLNALRWSWGPVLRTGPANIAQILSFRRRNGAMTYLYYACELRSYGGRVADWRWA